jgi:hypothetical protein
VHKIEVNRAWRLLSLYRKVCMGCCSRQLLTTPRHVMMNRKRQELSRIRKLEMWSRDRGRSDERLFCFALDPSKTSTNNTRTTSESLDGIPAILLRQPHSCTELISIHLWASTLRPFLSVSAASPASPPLPCPTLSPVCRVPIRVSHLCCGLWCRVRLD